MMIDLRSEDDLWRLFGGEDHLQPGKWQLSFEVLKRQLYDHDGFHKHRPDEPKVSEIKKAKTKIKLRFPLKDPNRRYLLIAGDRQACVDQAKLLSVGKAMRDPELVVQYLGSS